MTAGCRSQTTEVAVRRVVGLVALLVEPGRASGDDLQSILPGSTAHGGKRWHKTAPSCSKRTGDQLAEDAHWEAFVKAPIGSISLCFV